MWQLLGFGEVDTADRRYAIVDPNGHVHWAGDDVHDAAIFVLRHGLEHRMERNADGDSFVRESPRPKDPSNNDLEHGLGPWGGAGE